MPSVRQAEDSLIGKHDKEYLPISGLPEFTNAAVRLAYGADSPLVKDGKVFEISVETAEGLTVIPCRSRSRNQFLGLVH